MYGTAVRELRPAPGSLARNARILSATLGESHFYSSLISQPEYNKAPSSRSEHSGAEILGQWELPPFLHIGAAAPRVPWLPMGACEPPSEEENFTRSVRLGHLLSLQRTWFRYQSVRFWAGGPKQGVPGLSEC